jgi:hypothetical protein
MSFLSKVTGTTHLIALAIFAVAGWLAVPSHIHTVQAVAQIIAAHQYGSIGGLVAVLIPLLYFPSKG